MVGEYLKARRLELGKRRKDIANACCCTSAAVGAWERGEAVPSGAHVLLALAQELELPLDALLETLSTYEPHREAV